ncbi:MAG: hypothetical protein HFF09_06630 [Oscillospiraceae bacterium]|nr:hypothetical protein [Oscillospiraceae bacterium]
MNCPRCGIEARAKERKENGDVIMVCRNPQCMGFGAVVAVLHPKKK